MTAATPPTWAAIAAQLGDLADEDREALRRLTAPARHAWRVEQTIAAAAAAVPGHPCRATQAALIALDLHGTGGFAGCGGSATITSTLRAAWARGLGKGRWQAADGRAYRAAAEQALGALVAAELEARRATASKQVQVPLSDSEWVEQHGCGLLDSPWALGCQGLPVLNASVISAALDRSDDSTIAAQARGYALHRMAERAEHNKPIESEGSAGWIGILRAARERLTPAAPTAPTAEAVEIKLDDGNEVAS